MKMTLVKRNQIKETTKTVYTTEVEPNGIEIEIIKHEPVQLVKPLSKEQAHALWNIKTITEKKMAIVIALESLTYMSHSKTRDRLAKIKKIEQLDMLIADLLIYSEDAAEAENQKRLQKANPFYIEE
jgi:hypothetical protein